MIKIDTATHPSAPPEATSLSLSNESGQGLVEFSMILILFIGIFVGVFEVMSLYRQRSDLEFVTRNAARNAALIHLDSGPLQTQAEALIKDGLRDFGYTDADFDAGKLVVSVNTYEYDSGADDLVDTAGTQCVYGDYVSVRADWEWKTFVVPLDTFFDAPGSGTHTEEHIFKCYRGS